MLALSVLERVGRDLLRGHDDLGACRDEEHEAAMVANATPARSFTPSGTPGREYWLDGRTTLRRPVAVERTLILIKPDAVGRKLAGEILGRIERRGLDIRAGKLIRVDRTLGETHYAEHREKPFFGELVDFITSGPTWALVVEGEGAIAAMRKTIGATNPADAEPGSIRGDLAVAMPDNLVHGSDSPESAQREIALWFGDDELD